ncbi:hypothetical protein AeRB84_016625 [Aphanomyces euteiches]|nr:hypothetical protein AeRB84_016625 [Aphanomyces euteiches]
MCSIRTHLLQRSRIMEHEQIRLSPASLRIRELQATGHIELIDVNTVSPMLSVFVHNESNAAQITIPQIPESSDYPVNVSTIPNEHADYPDRTGIFIDLSQEATDSAQPMNTMEPIVVVVDDGNVVDTIFQRHPDVPSLLSPGGLLPFPNIAAVPETKIARPFSIESMMSADKGGIILPPISNPVGVVQAQTAPIIQHNNQQATLHFPGNSSNDVEVLKTEVEQLRAWYTKLHEYIMHLENVIIEGRTKIEGDIAPLEKEVTEMKQRIANVNRPSAYIVSYDYPSMPAVPGRPYLGQNSMNYAVGCPAAAPPFNVCGAIDPRSGEICYNPRNACESRRSRIHVDRGDVSEWSLLCNHPRSQNRGGCRNYAMTCSSENHRETRRLVLQEFARQHPQFEISKLLRDAKLSDTDNQGTPNSHTL